MYSNYKNTLYRFLLRLAGILLMLSDRALVWIVLIYFIHDTLWYCIFDQSLSPLFSRSPSGVSGAGGEGRRLGLARGIGASRGAVYGAAPPSPSLFPECRAHPGAEGERAGPGEGRRLLICSSKAVNRLRRFKNVKQTVPDQQLDSS